MARYEVYTINGLVGVARSYKGAVEIAKDIPANTNGRFGILVKNRKNSYPHSGYAGKDGVCHQATMLLYPPDTKCRMWKPEEYIREAVGTTRKDG